MSSLAAASLVIGILVFVGGPILYWVFFKMDGEPGIGPVSEGSKKPLTKDEIGKIESLLAVALPASYKEYLLSPEPRAVDDTTVFIDFRVIIDATIDYRRGFEGLTPWPQGLVYIGDEGDASPYILDTVSGAVSRHPKGEISEPAFEVHASFDALILSKT